MRADVKTSLLETPKRTKIANVDFYRTKHGNLIRASALNMNTNKHAPQCEHFIQNGIYPTTTPHSHKRQFQADISPSGTCPYGPRCHFAHDPSKVAICKDYLRTGTCPNGDFCDMSHEMTYHRVPACAFFSRGNCTNSACRYPHVKVSPAAPVCRAFAKLGYCAKGAQCQRRHVNECPDYANHGFCADQASGRCPLPHIQHACVLRKKAEREAKVATGEESDASSGDDDEGLIDGDIDSDAEEFIITGDASHQVSQQADFIAF
jgi:hypothetical protein